MPHKHVSCCYIEDYFKPVFPEEGESRESYDARREAKIEVASKIINIGARMGLVAYNNLSNNATPKSSTGKATQLLFSGDTEKIKVMLRQSAQFLGDPSGNFSGGKSRRSKKSKSRKLKSRSKKSKSKK